MALNRRGSFGSLAQVASAVAPAEFDFTTLGTVKIDTRPDGIAGADASAISSFTDNAGVAFTQGTGALQPTLRLNVKNTHSVIRGDATDRLSAGSSVISLAHAMTAYIVVKPASVHDGALFSTVDFTNGEVFRFKNDGGSLRLRYFSGGTGTDFNPSASANDWMILTLIVRATTGGNGTITLRKNGAEITTTAAVPRAASHEQSLALLNLPTTAQGFDGDLARILIYQGEHTSTQWDVAEDELNTLYTVY
jgi:hypothetical protein